MSLLVRLPGGERRELWFVSGATISDVIKHVSGILGVGEELICCLMDGRVILPFVNVAYLPMVEIRFVSEIEVKISPTPRNPGRVRGVVANVMGAALPMIIDTGAVMSAIYSAQALACGIEWMIDTRPCHRSRFVGVEGVPCRRVGIIHALQITFGGLTTHLKVAVIDGDALAGLLGIDWLHANEAIIDLVNDCMYVGSLRIPFRDL
jgi:hypothetical protein